MERTTTAMEAWTKVCSTPAASAVLSPPSSAMARTTTAMVEWTRISECTTRGQVERADWDTLVALGTGNVSTLVK